MSLRDGTPKGMKLILEERGIDTYGLKKDELQDILSKQPDFMEDSKNCLVKDLLTNDNPHCIVEFLPKFHCELNPAENVWMNFKNNFRQ